MPIFNLSSDFFAGYYYFFLLLNEQLIFFSGIINLGNTTCKTLEMFFFR